jgi:hypothetical protein
MTSSVPGFLWISKCIIDQARNHLALAIAYGRHIDADILLADAEFIAPEEKRCDLGACESRSCLAGRRCWKGTADPFALRDDDALSFRAKVQARYLPPSPLPRTTRSYSSGFVTVVVMLVRVKVDFGSD